MANVEVSKYYHGKCLRFLSIVFELCGKVCAKSRILCLKSEGYLPRYLENLIVFDRRVAAQLSTQTTRYRNRFLLNRGRLLVPPLSKLGQPASPERPTIAKTL